MTHSRTKTWIAAIAAVLSAAYAVSCAAQPGTGGKKAQNQDFLGSYEYDDNIYVNPLSSVMPPVKGADAGVRFYSGSFV